MHVARLRQKKKCEVLLVNETQGKKIFEKSGCRFVCTRQGKEKIHPRTGYEGPEGK